MQLAQSYLQGMGSPFDGVLEAYGYGQQLRQNKDTLQAQQAEQARKIQAQQALESLDWNDMGAVRRVVAQFPEYTKGAQDYYGQMEAKAQQGLLGTMSRGISALQSGSNQVASDLFRAQAEGYRNNGDDDAAETADWLAEMSLTDPATAQRALMIQYAGLSDEKSGANLEAYGKALNPQRKEVDTGDQVQSYAIDPVTGEVSGAEWIADKAATPDNVLDNETLVGNNIRTNQASENNNIRTNTVSEGNNIRTNETGRYSADVASQDRRLKLDQDGKIGWAKVSQAQQKIDNPAANRKQIPPSAMKTMGELQQKLVSNAQTMKENQKWMDSLINGDLQLSAGKNFGNTFAARTGITAAGSNPQAYAEFNAYIKDLANKALRLNAGVQTDADYKRQLEAIVSGGNLPRDNGIAVGLLKRMHKDFDSQNRAIYQNLAGYKKEYAGVDIPAYGSNRTKANTSTNNGGGNSKGASIIEGVFRSK